MSEHTTPSQHQRWIKYGLNVAVLILATLTIIILVNWMGYRHFQRFDLTRTRQYSLSPQTTNLLQDLDTDITVTTFYSAGSAQSGLLQRVDDLLAEYTRRSTRIDVKHIDPAASPELRDKYITKLKTRYQSELDKASGAFGDVAKTYDAIRQFASGQVQTLPGILVELPASDRTTPLLFKQLVEIFQRLDDSLTNAQKQIESAMKESMPDYQGAVAVARRPLTQLSSGVLDVAVERFQRAVNDPNMPDKAKDALLGLIKPYKDMRLQIQDASGRLDAVETPEYDRVRNSLMQSNCVIVTIPAEQAEEHANETHGVVVLTLDEIYPNLIRAEMTRGEVMPEEGYKGEETITGAILRLTLRHNARVVFINPSPQSVLSGRGNPQISFMQVAERLRRMNFDVDEWQPGGSMGPMGQPMPPQPAPVAEQGETLVYIVLPVPPPNPQRPTQPMGPMIAQAVKTHLDAGQPAMVFAAPSSMMNFGQPDPLVEMIKPYGLTIDTGRLIMRHVPGRNGQLQADNQLIINTWPTDHAISKAASGLQGLLLQAMPIELSSNPPEGEQLWPLIQSPADTWADTDYMRPAQATKGEDDPTGPFVVGAAVEKDKLRLIAIADASFAVDGVTQYGPRDLFGNTLFSRFPGNSEVFVNSVYWLSGLDRLIAPGARTQDTRRIDAVSRPAMLAVWWITVAGLPVMCLAAGMIVWVVRRR